MFLSRNNTNIQNKNNEESKKLNLHSTENSPSAERKYVNKTFSTPERSSSLLSSERRKIDNSEVSRILHLIF